MLHVQCLKQKGPQHLRNAFPIEHIVALELLEILSCDPVTNYCSKEKKSRTERKDEKVQDVRLIFFPLFIPCVSQSLLQTCMRKQILYTLVCYTDTIPGTCSSLDNSRQEFFYCYCEICMLQKEKKLGVFFL